MEYVINLAWDNDADVWIATSDDIPGLVLESGSFAALLERLRFAVPELIALNFPPRQISLYSVLRFKSSRKDCFVMAEYEKKVRRLLKQYGCSFVRRGKGDHDIWYSPLTSCHITVDTKIKSRHTAIDYRFR